MKQVFHQNQLYTYLLFCNRTDLEKKILDCGAGGMVPPLAIFNEDGYETQGIDISKEQIKRAKNYEQKNGVNLNIIEGNMLDIPFADNSFSFVYSYNSIFHMSKEDIQKALKEIRRVIKKGGLAFVNFPTVNDDRATSGEYVRDGEYLQEEHGSLILHSYFEVDEADKYFKGFKIIYKENRIRDIHTKDGVNITKGYVDYIIKKL